MSCTCNHMLIRVYSELYSSETSGESPRQPGCLLLRIIVGLMGTYAYLWSLYLVIGNELKYNNPNDIARRSSTLSTLRQLVHLLCTLWATQTIYLIALRLLRGLCGGSRWRQGTEQRVHTSLPPRILLCSVGDRA